MLVLLIIWGLSQTLQLITWADTSLHLLLGNSTMIKLLIIYFRAILSASSRTTPTSSNNNNVNDIKTSTPRRTRRTHSTGEGQSPERPSAHGIRVFDLFLIVVVLVSLCRIGPGLDDSTEWGPTHRAPGEVKHEVPDRPEAQLQAGGSVEFLNEVSISIFIAIQVLSLLPYWFYLHCHILVAMPT